MTKAIQKLASDLENLGLRNGDVVTVRAGLKDILSDQEKLALTGPSRANYLIEAILEVIGSSGTIMVLTFTNQFLWPFISKKEVFTSTSTPNSGAIAHILLQQEKVLRSTHPICSFAAVGPMSQYLLQGHDHTAPSYLPVKKIIELEGKFLNIGVDPHSPGFTTAHWAQWSLGLATQYRFKYGTYYLNKHGKNVLFIREDIGGCSAALSNFYPHYLEEGILREGFIGKASAKLLLNSKSAFNIEMELLSKEPSYTACNKPSCVDCRIGWKFNDADYATFLWHYIKKILRRST